MSKLAHSNETTMEEIEARRVLADRMDADANAFAMELLMPESLLRVDAKGIDICDERAVQKLANKYRVPTSAMAIRLGQLSATNSPRAGGGD